MTEKEKETIKELSDIVSKLDEGSQKYLLGLAEGIFMARQPAERERNLQEV